MKNKTKGNFAFNTAIGIFLVVFALAILLAFVWKNVNPTTTKTDHIRKRTMLCQQYIQYDANCDGNLDSEEDEAISNSFSDITKKLNDVCNILGTPRIKTCCQMYCGD